MRRFQYQRSEDFGLPLVERLGHYPRYHDWTWRAMRFLGSWFAPLMIRAQFRLIVDGRPPDDPKVAIVANHQSHLDTLALLASLPWRRRANIHVLAAADHFFRRTTSALGAALLCQAIAFERLGWTGVRAWYRHLRDAQAQWILFYPSGSRRVHELHGGLLKVLLKSGWTIQPARLTGMVEAWPADARCWRPFRTLRVTFLEPYRDADCDALLHRLREEFDG